MHNFNKPGAGAFKSKQALLKPAVTIDEVTKAMESSLTISDLGLDDI